MSVRRAPRLIDGRAALAVVARPHLWGAGVSLILRMAPRDWWRRWPPLPSPSRAYAAFRLHTALGGPDRLDRPLDADEVVAFLEWCRRLTLLSRGRRRRG